LPHSAVPVEPQVGREYGETTAALHLRAKAHKSSYMSKSIYFFPGDAKATLGEVGGKGLSLLESSRALLPVPPGCILTVHFFEPWLSQLKTTDAWKIFLEASNDALAHACAVLKQATVAFPFTEAQEKILTQALRKFDADARREVFVAARGSGRRIVRRRIRDGPWHHARYASRRNQTMFSFVARLSGGRVYARQ
jgi:hypothetical protein